MYGRYIKSDGSIEAGAYYSWSTHGANESTSGGEHGQWEVQILQLIWFTIGGMVQTINQHYVK